MFHGVANADPGPGIGSFESGVLASLVVGVTAWRAPGLRRLDLTRIAAD